MELLKKHPPKFCVILYFHCDIIHPTHRVALEYKMVILLYLYCHHPGSTGSHSWGQPPKLNLSGPTQLVSASYLLCKSPAYGLA